MVVVAVRCWKRFATARKKSVWGGSVPGRCKSKGYRRILNRVFSWAEIADCRNHEKADSCLCVQALWAKSGRIFSSCTLGNRKPSLHRRALGFIIAKSPPLGTGLPRVNPYHRTCGPHFRDRPRRGTAAIAEVTVQNPMRHSLPLQLHSCAIAPLPNDCLPHDVRL